MPRSEEYAIFAERFIHFMNLWTIYNDLLSGDYIPTVNPPSEKASRTDMRSTMMLVVLAYFYSLIEDDDQSLNAFRIWRRYHPEEETAIAAVEAQVTPFRPRLKLFRNRMGSHGSRTRSHEDGGKDLFAKHTGTETWEAIESFNILGAALFAKEGARKGLEANDPVQIRQEIDSIAKRARKRPNAPEAENQSRKG